MLVTQHHGDHLLLESIAVAPGAQGGGQGRGIQDGYRRVFFSKSVAE